ncbi:Ppx/GppA phosphatase family protein [Oceanomicrobium pacificus]|uniref:Exopolyphosphatase n=1 Tax=Oceanomicrobium pacificus TaxID=2692916 RepID=A0A6B0TUC7_9RHOB|nr:Ppx/GppA family phosphatase [Oceanomicrobium pacificus]MXU65375.1 exopolyphosphatase [Oceanomicrobium pacificus]
MLSLPDGPGAAPAPPADPVARMGVIDVGSNSVRFVVFDGIARSPAYFYNEKILCGLGAGLAESGRLNPQGRIRALNALHRFAALSREMKLGGLVAVATAAVREAEDGPAFCARVAAETGLTIRVASGAEEAEFSAKGVLLGWPHANGLVCDIGGASMELAQVADGQIGRLQTSPLGPLKLRDLIEGGGDLRTHLKDQIGLLRQSFPEAVHRLFLVGGSWRAIARLDMYRRDYPLMVLHEYELAPKDLRDTLDWIADSTPEDLAGLTDTSSARLALVPLAARVLRRMLKSFSPELVSFSSYGLREGVLYDRMPVSLRESDPLLEVARHLEARESRFPGFGAALYDWMQPIVSMLDEAEQRVVRAACHMHDIAWRAHPDYRGEICFDSVARANYSGLDHRGRMFLGLAVLARYKNAEKMPEYALAAAMLPPHRVEQALTLGKALRLGAMLSGSVGGALLRTRLSVESDRLVLTLSGPDCALEGEAVERRLAALADRLGLAPELRATA